MPQERLFLSTPDHDIPLLIDKPNRHQNFPCILMLHGFMAYKEGDGYLLQKMAKRFVEQGIACARFDFASMGENRYTRENYTIETMVKETRFVYAYLCQHPQINQEKIIIMGHSLGCRVACYCLDLPSYALIFLNGAIDFTKPHFLEKLTQYDKRQNPVIISTSDGRKELLYQAFLEEPSIQPNFKQYDNPIYICIGNNDPTIDPNVGRMTYHSILKSSKYLIEISGANHTFNAKTGDDSKIDELSTCLLKHLNQVNFI